MKMKKKKCEMEKKWRNCERNVESQIETRKYIQRKDREIMHERQRHEKKSKNLFTIIIFNAIIDKSRHFSPKEDKSNSTPENDIQETSNGHTVF